MPGRDRDAVQLRAVAPIVVAATKQLVGPAMLVTNGLKTIAITGSELLRAWDPTKLALATALDGSQLVPIASWGLGRYSSVGLVELARPIGDAPDVVPLSIGAVCATVDTRGAPSALVTILAANGGFVREVIPVFVDSLDGGMSDELTRLASPIEPTHVGVDGDGAILFSWFPPDPVLGRTSEVLAVAIGYPYRQTTYKPRDLPPLVELFGLDDLGRALIRGAQPDPRPELHEVTGEIAEVRSDGDRPVLDPVEGTLEEIRKSRERNQ